MLIIIRSWLSCLSKVWLSTVGVDNLGNLYHFGYRLKLLIGVEILLECKIGSKYLRLDALFGPLSG